MNISNDPSESCTHEQTSHSYEPPYMKRVRQMSFDETIRFLEDALELLLEAEVRTDFPQTETDLYAVLRILRERHQQVAGATLDAELDGEDSFTRTSVKYEKHVAKLERLENYIAEQTGLPSTRKKDIHQMQRSRERLEREAGELRLELEAMDASGFSESHTVEDTRLRMADDIAKRIDRALSYSGRVRKGRLQWRMLPAGQATAAQLYGLSQRTGRGGERGGPRKFDLERLERAFDLRPSHMYQGADGFDGYIIFVFPYTSKVLMECPVKGNAIYVISSDWERWSRMTKQELREDYTGDVLRIDHRGEWFERLKGALGYVEQ